METDLNAHLAAQGIQPKVAEPTVEKVVSEPLTPVEQTSQTPEGTQQTPQEDLVTRVSQFTQEKGPEAQPSDINKEFKFDYSKLDTIQTAEEAKTFTEDAYKSMQRGFNQKFQEIAELRKELQATNETQKGWTPDKVQSLLSDPNFINSAQQLNQSQNPQESGLTNDEYSTLSDTEKSSLNLALSESKQTRNELQKLQQTRDFEKQDTQLSQKYSNYNPSQVDKLYGDMMSGNVSATREALWQVLDYEPGMNRAYEMGVKDGQKNGSEMSNSASVEGRNIISSAPLEREKGESGRNYFKRIAERNLAALQGAK